MQNENQQISTLIELNDELENYFRNTIIPQLFIDAKLILRKFTPPAMRQFKLALTDVGRPIIDIQKNLRFSGIIENIKHVIETGEILEKEIQTTDMRWYQMNILPYLVQKEKITNGVIITFVEITMRIKDLKEQEKLITEHEMLLDTISHDIKQPLAGLSLAIQILKKIPDRSMLEYPKLLADVEVSLLNTQQVIADLTKTRWEKHRYAAVEELLNFEHILEDVRLTLAPQIKESNAVIKSDIGLSEVTFVRRKLRSIVYNLVSNAIKYHAPERIPEVLIKTAEEDGFMVISVSDNGVGIASKDYKTVFEKYERLESLVEGTGIGLYLVKEIITNAGGRITLKSELGKGSLFKVFLKLKAQPRKFFNNRIP